MRTLEPRSTCHEKLNRAQSEGAGPRQTTVANTAVDYSVFLWQRAALKRIPAAIALFTALSCRCGCNSPEILLLIVANVTSWVVPAAGPYILNSSITFAAESERRLNGRAYATFVVSAIIGLIANKTTLVCAAQVLLLPILIAKASQFW
jgi:hypothetical protein